MFTTVWKDHLVLARNAANPNRLWFSNGGDPTAWDTAADGQWLDLTYVPNGLTTLRGMILSFSENAMERIRGDIIPGVAGSDVVRELMFNVGCPDPGAIAASDDYVVFANPNGVYLTDGIGLIDLTQQCGVKSYWRDIFGSVYSSSYNFTGGLYQGHYIVSSMSGTTLTDCMCFDIVNRRAWRLGNVKPAMMATAPTSTGSMSGELLFAERDNPYVSRLGQIFLVHGGGGDGGITNTLELDGDGDAVTYRMHTGYLRGLPGRKRWRRFYVTYTMADAATSGVYEADVEWYHDLALPTSYGQQGILTETGGASSRHPVPVTNSPTSEGVVVKIGNSTSSGNDFRLFKIEAEVRPIEQSR
jgi:hypothetical protein